MAALALEPDAPARLRLVIVGDGSLRPEIEEVLRADGVRELAWLPGERSDVAPLLPALDAFVLPSLAEGISNTILEAMACGVPVIATDVGGNRELVAEGETGMLVPAGDVPALAAGILRLADDAAMRARFGLGSRARALDSFSLGEMVRRYALLYERELRRRAPGAAMAEMAPPALMD